MSTRQTHGPGNELVKYADDTYLVIPAINNHTSEEELQQVQEWAEENNLCLNASRCKEITFQSSRATARKSQQLPPLCLDKTWSAFSTNCSCSHNQ